MKNVNTTAKNIPAYVLNNENVNRELLREASVVLSGIIARNPFPVDENLAAKEAVKYLKALIKELGNDVTGS